MPRKISAGKRAKRGRPPGATKLTKEETSAAVVKVRGAKAVAATAAARKAAAARIAPAKAVAIKSAAVMAASAKVDAATVATVQAAAAKATALPAATTSATTGKATIFMAAAVEVAAVSVAAGNTSRTTHRARTMSVPRRATSRVAVLVVWGLVQLERDASLLSARSGAATAPLSRLQVTYCARWSAQSSRRP
eukprot:TRINITY_DN2537_c0_g1_i3.p1 TRINITY_DN2537_c0_g1~~TRINITY_DN2537_c0_g1_i3.p1  ORF type:complete len:193 (+),score=36.15 TRINITY_DN2537_c0_g1_i3:499-1077(+)